VNKMPRGDGTGPGGFGSMTGRGAGFCAGFSVPGYMNPYGGRMGFGRGMGFGRSMGFGRDMGFGRGSYGYPTPYAGSSNSYDTWGMGTVSPKQELEMLKGQAEVLEDQMDGIKSRIQELEKEKKEK